MAPLFCRTTAASCHRAICRAGFRLFATRRAKPCRIPKARSSAAPWRAWRWSIAGWRSDWMRSWATACQWCTSSVAALETGCSISSPPTPQVEPSSPGRWKRRPSATYWCRRWPWVTSLRWTKVAHSSAVPSRWKPLSRATPRPGTRLMNDI